MVQFSPAVLSDLMRLPLVREWQPRSCIRSLLETVRLSEIASVLLTRQTGCQQKSADENGVIAGVAFVC